MSEPSTAAPSMGVLADVRRSGRLAATKGFPPGVCPHPAGSVLAQVWLQAYTDAAGGDMAEGGETA
ncbi:Rmf/CrpP family protein [Streptosporangium sp. NPDC051022]|uniref:Rmf/CrpP family protein n=1 Tax=Streptosporangium sp. NPDC051022 TaxID=3155752 RepID=UPI003414F1E6